MKNSAISMPRIAIQVNRVPPFAKGAKGGHPICRRFRVGRQPEARSYRAPEIVNVRTLSPAITASFLPVAAATPVPPAAPAPAPMAAPLPPPTSAPMTAPPAAPPPILAAFLFVWLEPLRLTAEE